LLVSVEARQKTKREHPGKAFDSTGSVGFWLLSLVLALSFRWPGRNRSCSAQKAGSNMFVGSVQATATPDCIETSEDDKRPSEGTKDGRTDRWKEGKKKENTVFWRNGLGKFKCNDNR